MDAGRHRAVCLPPTNNFDGPLGNCSARMFELRVTESSARLRQAGAEPQAVLIPDRLSRMLLRRMPRPVDCRRYANRSGDGAWLQTHFGKHHWLGASRRVVRDACVRAVHLGLSCTLPKRQKPQRERWGFLWCFGCGSAHWMVYDAICNRDLNADQQWSQRVRRPLILPNLVIV